LAGDSCQKCGNKVQKSWKTIGKGPSPMLLLECQSCKNKRKIATSKTWKGDNRISLAYILMMLSILFSGSTWAKFSFIFSLMEINTGSKSNFIGKFQDKVDVAVKEVLSDFLRDCRKSSFHPDDTFVILDAGWSHAGWWARECTVTAIDGYSGLPISVIHVKKGRQGNYIGSSKGMEGFGVLKIMKELKEAGFTVTKVLHDKDSSTMKNVLEVFQDVQESLCVEKYEE
jgi:hypothetical protein